MRFFEKFRARRRRNKRIKAAKALKTSLREFVYLDEVSVYSLLASRQGALAAEYTNTQTNVSGSELSSNAGAGAGVFKAGLASKIQSTQTESIQVLRKSTVQAAFKELYEGEEERLAISPKGEGTQSPPPVRTWENVENGIGDARFDGWIIDPRHLRRGSLVELEVELQADAAYRAVAVVTALHDMIKESPELFASTSSLNMDEIRAINRVLNQFLVGLIPIRCKAVDFQIAKLKGVRMLVHKGLLTQVKDAAYRNTEPLHIVGVTEERLYWKDVRRVLFSGSTFRVMCRLNHGEIRNSWVPVKLVDVLSSVAPELAEQVDQLGPLFFGTPAAAGPSNRASRTPAINVLASYAASLAQQYDADPGSLDLTQAGLPAELSIEDMNDLEVRRRAFQSVTTYVAQVVGITPDSVTAARLRSAALMDFGLWLDGQRVTQRDAVDEQKPGRISESILETEIVAMYW